VTIDSAILALGIVTATIALLSLLAHARVTKRLDHDGSGYNGYKESIINAIEAGRQAFREAIECKR